MTERSPKRPTMISGDQVIEPDSASKSVLVVVRKRFTPDRCRELGIALLYAADSAEDEDAEFGFGYDVNDSQELCELRTVMDDLIGWASDEDELDGDYVARLRQVAEEWKRLRTLRVVK